jgi:hypothetical protein
VYRPAPFDGYSSRQGYTVLDSQGFPKQQLQPR